MLSLCEVAVGAFKVAIELEVKRRDNDKKIDLLFLEMRNMMSALLQCVVFRALQWRASHVGCDQVTEHTHISRRTGHVDRYSPPEPHQYGSGRH